MHDEPGTGLHFYDDTPPLWGELHGGPLDGIVALVGTAKVGAGARLVFFSAPTDARQFGRGRRPVYRPLRCAEGHPIRKIGRDMPELGLFFYEHEGFE